MSEVKWIKITTDMFENRKIKAIRKLPEGNNIILIWVMLLSLAGRCNASGMIFLTANIPYTNKMLADELDFEESVICIALDTLEKFGMITRDENLFISVNNWAEYQSVDGMDKIREQTRKRMEDYRIRKREGVTSVGESCVYCGKPANAVDHLIPKSKGGPDKNWNLVPCCKSCNSGKKDKDLADFLNDSFIYDYQGVNHELVRKNKKIMSIVDFIDGKYVQKDVLRNSCGNVTDSSISISYSLSNSNSLNLNILLDTYSSNYKYIIDNKELLDTVREWMEYKDQKKPKASNQYAENGMKRFLKKVIDESQKHGIENVVETISDSIANNYQGVTWDRLGSKKGNSSYMDAIRNRVSEVDKWV